MDTTEITIALPTEQLQEMRDLVKDGEASTLSGFVQHAVAVALHDAAGWRKMLDHAVTQSGGPLTQKEREWADSVLIAKKQKTKSSKCGNVVE